MPDNVKLRMNPNLKAEAMKTAEEKIGGKIVTEKEALQALQNGQRLSNILLALLSRKGLIEVSDVTNADSPPGEREYIFTFFTERGRQVLEG